MGGSATFTVGATGTAPLSYQWQRNQVNIAGATATSYTLSSAQLSDNGARFRAIVSNGFGSATSNEAVLTVTSNGRSGRQPHRAGRGDAVPWGQTINYAGDGTDPEQGTCRRVGSAGTPCSFMTMGIRTPILLWAGQRIEIRFVRNPDDR